MSDNAYSPLPASLVRTLTDKLYEKRKVGALEVEKVVREMITANQTQQTEKALAVLGDLARNQNPQMRKGGLIGLAAAAIALGKASGSVYSRQLIEPVLQCFTDADHRVRYYACESLYNIVKVTRDASLVHFKELFDTLCKLSADADQNVRNGSELLDRLLKDIATASPTFKLADFMCLLRERIYTKNTNARRFLVSWVQAIYTVPDLNLLPYLPEVLDGFFQILSDPDQRIRELCESVMGEFLKSIASKPDQAESHDMVNILIVHAQSQDDLVQHTALIWLREFLPLNGKRLLPFVSGYLTAVLPCLSYGNEERKSIRDTAGTVNNALMVLVTEDTDEMQLLLDLPSVVTVLHNYLKHDAVPTRVAVLRWIHHLYQKMPTKTFPFMEELFPILQTLLSDPSDEVVLLDLEVLSDLCSGLGGYKSHISSLGLPQSTEAALQGSSPYFVKFVISLLEAFRKDTSLLLERGPFIIRQLCVLLKADEIFRTASILLELEQDCQFTSQMVQTLNSILLTATELFPLRNQLKDLDIKNQHTIDLFVRLYKCWAHQPVALVALCLLTKNYNHAAQLIQLFSDIEITVDFLIEVDKLIQLLESPIFTYLRLQLLDPNQRDLTTVLYGLLMLLPQTEAFHTLCRRLQSMPTRFPPTSPPSSESRKSQPPTGAIPFNDLLQYFKSTQERHRQFRRQKHREVLARTA